MSRINVDKITGATGTASGAPITLSGDTATLGSGVDLGLTANHSGVKTALNASGSAPIYACRAWVNFNGTGTVAIRDSGNVSSITDNGTGDYTINFTTAMSDGSYSVQGTAGGTSGSRPIVKTPKTNESFNNSNFDIQTLNENTASLFDTAYISLTVVR